jgi:hypothetical protein
MTILIYSWIWCYTYGVANLVLGSQPRQGGYKLVGQEKDSRITSHALESAKSEGMNLHIHKWTPMLGVGVPNGFPNLQNAIAKFKTHRLKELFISLKSYWSVDV